MMSREYDTQQVDKGCWQLCATKNTVTLGNHQGTGKEGTGREGTSNSESADVNLSDNL